MKGISEEEMFKVVKTGKKTAKKAWKRMITKPTFGIYLHYFPPPPPPPRQLHQKPEFVGTNMPISHLVGPDFTRRPVKYERFIRPMGLRYKKAHVTHPELKVTVQLPIISVKKV